MDRPVRLALIQQPATEDREENRSRGLINARAAAESGANVIAFAELAFDPFYPQKPATERGLSKAEPIPGPTVDPFKELARDLGVVVILNVFERSGKDTFDSSPVIDADGSVLGVTRMVHITDYPHFHEKGYYVPGDGTVSVYETRVGRVGVAICYDRHYPEYMRALGIAGAELVVVPQAGAVDEWPEGLFEAEMRVAAFQNGYFTALVNRVGAESDLHFAGESFVCDPTGSVVARAGAIDEILFCDIDLKEVERSHARTLFFRDRRPDLYRSWF